MNDEKRKLPLRELSTILFDLKHGYLSRQDPAWMNPAGEREIIDELRRRGLVTSTGEPDPASGVTIAALRLTDAGEELYEELAAVMRHRWGIVGATAEGNAE